MHRQLRFRNDVMPFKTLAKSKLFFVRLLLLLFVGAYIITVNILEEWPKFCYQHGAAFFVLYVILPSFFLFELATMITWIVFENPNWIYYFVYNILITFTGIVCLSIYYNDFLHGCTRIGNVWTNGTEISYFLISAMNPMGGDPDKDGLQSATLILIILFFYFIVAVLTAIYREELYTPVNRNS